MGSGRLIIDPPRSGVDNMAIDEWLMLQTSSVGQPVLRFYRWETATLSLGYFQPVADRSTHPASLSLPLVRRATGGGAIVHDHELTYSLVVPISNRLDDNHRQFYLDVHEAVVEVLAQFSIKAHLSPGVAARQDDPFLCFKRRAQGDVVVGDHKVLGSAQRRHAKALLQHGSILLRASSAAPTLPGLVELSETSCDETQLCQALIEAIGQAAGVVWDDQSLQSSELAEAATIAESKFGSPAWTDRR